MSKLIKRELQRALATFQVLKGRTKVPARLDIRKTVLPRELALDRESIAFSKKLGGQFAQMYKLQQPLTLKYGPEEEPPKIPPCRMLRPDPYVHNYALEYDLTEIQEGSFEITKNTGVTVPEPLGGSAVFEAEAIDGTLELNFEYIESEPKFRFGAELTGTDETFAYSCPIVEGDPPYKWKTKVWAKLKAKPVEPPPPSGEPECVTFQGKGPYYEFANFDMGGARIVGPSWLSEGLVAGQEYIRDPDSTDYHIHYDYQSDTMTIAVEASLADVNLQFEYFEQYPQNRIKDSAGRYTTIKSCKDEAEFEFYTITNVSLYKHELIDDGGMYEDY